MTHTELRTFLSFLIVSCCACTVQTPQQADGLTTGGTGVPMGGVGGSGGSGGASASGGTGGVPTGGVGAAGMGVAAMGGTGGAAGTGVAGNAGAGGIGGEGGSMDTPDASVGPGFPQLPRPTTTDGPGSFTEVTKVMNTPPGGWLIYPTKLGEGGMRHPLFIFGPGGGTTPETYEMRGMHWDRYASYGFVIYVLPASTGDGADMKAGLDWLIEQNEVAEGPLYHKLDITKVCAAGHSQGSVTTFDFMPDDRVTTTIHISGGSFDQMGPSKLRSDTMFMCAPDSSGDPAKPQCDSDFAVSTVPTFYTVVEGADHLSSARLGWAATIAWMLWHLAGQEDLWRAEFLEAGGQFQSGIYASQIKNW